MSPCDSLRTAGLRNREHEMKGSLHHETAGFRVFFRNLETDENLCCRFRNCEESASVGRTYLFSEKYHFSPALRGQSTQRTREGLKDKQSCPNCGLLRYSFVKCLSGKWKRYFRDFHSDAVIDVQTFCVPFPGPRMRAGVKKHDSPTITANAARQCVSETKIFVSMIFPHQDPGSEQ